MAVRTPGEIFSRRLLTAISSSVAIQIVFSRVLALVLNLDILQPGAWLAESIRAFNLSSLIQLTFVTAAQAYIFAFSCIATPQRRFSRFHMFLDLFTLQNIAFSVLHALSGYLTLGFYTSILNSQYSDLRKTCVRSEGQCLVEKNLFLECGGMWLGLYFYVKTHIINSTIILFPHAHQEKIHQIRGAIVGNTLRGFKDSVRPTLYFLLFYVIWGQRPRNVVKDVYSLYLEDAPLDNIFNLLGSGVWFTLWLYSSLFFMTVYNMRTVLKVFMTEPMWFPIHSTTMLSLQEGLSQRWKYSGMLAAQDYRRMACSDEERRKEVFTVSLPGGHPRIWSALLHETLLTIDSFSDELDAINAKNESKSPTLQTSPLRPYHCPPTLRNMDALSSPQSPNLQALIDQNRNKLEKPSKLRLVVDNQLQKLFQKPVVAYFFSELPDCKLKCLLSRAQPVMWTCEGLAYISAASLHEDRYGIVQNNLPAIIASLVRLKQNLERLTKGGLIPKKQSSDAFTVKMKTALLSSVRRSIYKIIHTFSRYINDLSLSPELHHAIQPFLGFKEY